MMNCGIQTIISHWLFRYSSAICTECGMHYRARRVRVLSVLSSSLFSLFCVKPPACFSPDVVWETKLVLCDTVASRCGRCDVHLKPLRRSVILQQIRVEQMNYCHGCSCLGDERLTKQKYRLFYKRGDEPERGWTSWATHETEEHLLSLYC